MLVPLIDEAHLLQRRIAPQGQPLKTIRELAPVRPSTKLRQIQDANSRTGAHSKLTTCHSPLATDLDWIVMRCLEKDRTRGYETANRAERSVARRSEMAGKLS